MPSTARTTTAVAAGLGFTLLAAPAALAGGGVTIDFEDLPANANYNRGDSITTGGIDFIFDSFTFSSGTTFNSGIANVASQGDAGGSGQELWTNNVQLATSDLPDNTTIISFNFGSFGGNDNLYINGFQFFSTDLFALDGQTLGPAEISITDLGDGRGGPGPKGRLTLTSTTPITTFKVGGQEFVVDDIRFVPTPGAMALMGLAALATVRRRRG